MKVYSISLLSINSATPATSTVLCQVNDLSSFSFYQRGSVGEFMGFFTKVSRGGLVGGARCSVASRAQFEDRLFRFSLASSFMFTLNNARHNPTHPALPTCKPPQTVAERTSPNTPSSIEENSYKAHVFRTPSAPGKTGLACVMITDLEYPYRPAFTLITKILDEQSALVSQLPTPGSSSIGASGGPSLAASGGLSPAQKGKLEATLQQYLSKYQDPTQADTIMKVQKELDETKIVLHKTIESVLERGEKIDNLVERSNALSNQSKMFYRTAKKVSCSRGFEGWDWGWG
jgi:synaptobrevin family protein YKT6